MAKATQSILIVDDEFGLAEMLREMLRESGFDVTLAQTPSNVIQPRFL